LTNFEVQLGASRLISSSILLTYCKTNNYKKNAILRPLTFVETSISYWS